MKVLIFAIVAIATAQAARDWSQIRHREIDPITKQLIPFRESRVVGGEEATPNEFPYQAALFILTAEGTFFCGGSIISTNYILTAAHCVDKAVQVEVVLGAHQIRDETEETQLRLYSTEVSVHAGWDPLFLRDDIAVVKLPVTIELSDLIQTVALPRYRDYDEHYVDRVSTVSGWGKDSDAATGISPVLRYVHVPIMGNPVCEIFYLGVIHDSNICSAGADKKGSCSGDSGGPLVVDGVQVGIVSFGISFGCEVGWPSVYTRTTSFLDWIVSHSDAVIEF